ncbi:MAG: hypothetical protein M3P91_04575 [Actinomycetota bacterium]|nr:hypothetical protein [Actinomycetota bacterium]
MSARVFPFRFTRAYRVAARPFGVTPATARVEMEDTELRVRFGRWRLTTSLSNVVALSRSADYRFFKTAGPAHLSLADRGVTFATNGDAGLCIVFAEPVQALVPGDWLHHPAATVTVADLDGLERLLRERASLR